MERREEGGERKIKGREVGGERFKIKGGRKGVERKRDCLQTTSCSRDVIACRPRHVIHGQTQIEQR